MATSYVFSSPTQLPNSHVCIYFFMEIFRLTYFWLWTFSLTVFCSPVWIFPAISSQTLYPLKDLESQVGQILGLPEVPILAAYQNAGTLVKSPDMQVSPLGIWFSQSAIIPGNLHFNK